MQNIGYALGWLASLCTLSHLWTPKAPYRVKKPCSFGASCQTNHVPVQSINFINHPFPWWLIVLVASWLVTPHHWTEILFSCLFLLTLVSMRKMSLFLPWIDLRDNLIFFWQKSSIPVSCICFKTIAIPNQLFTAA